MTGSDAHDERPLLVRRFLAGGDPEPGTRWPASEYRTIRSHRADAAAEPAAERKPARERAAATEEKPAAEGKPATAGKAAPERRRQCLTWVAAGALFAFGLTAGGLGLLRQGPVREDVPIPSGALPAIAAPSAVIATTGPVPNSPHATAPAGDQPPEGQAAEPRGETRGETQEEVPTTRPVAPEPPRSEPVELDEPSPPLSPAGNQAARVGLITDDSGQCLAGDPVEVADCTGAADQQWALAPDGTLQVGGECAQVTDGSTVEVDGCDAGEAAQWRPGDDGTLVNEATDACLTGAGGSSAEVIVTPCAATDDQQWVLPD